MIRNAWRRMNNRFTGYNNWNVLTGTSYYRQSRRYRAYIMDKVRLTIYLSPNQNARHMPKQQVSIPPNTIDAISGCTSRKMTECMKSVCEVFRSLGWAKRKGGERIPKVKGLLWEVKETQSGVPPTMKTRIYSKVKRGKAIDSARLFNVKGWLRKSTIDSKLSSPTIKKEKVDQHEGKVAVQQVGNRLEGKDTWEWRE